MIENPEIVQKKSQKNTKAATYAADVLKDYWICRVSRETSLLGRREVLTGKAKFGILGDGKEVPQVAMARAFQKGDWRSGYYRDQTFMFALGLSTVEDFFAQLYADTENDPFSGGRQMNCHYSSPAVDQNGDWTNHQEIYNISSDISCTGGQMARGLGLAFASKKYRESETLRTGTSFSDKGNEVCFCTIGDASTSEGIFWETMNAAVVLQVPLAVSVWDDGYGISVPKKYQTAKESISAALSGMKQEHKNEGLRIYNVKGWDYPALCKMYEEGIADVRKNHTPALFHVEDLTQPQGHSTSGSHERYKDADRLKWEKNNDCVKVMRNWILSEGIADETELQNLEADAKNYVRKARKKAWDNYYNPIKEYRQNLEGIYTSFESEKESVRTIKEELKKLIDPTFSELIQNARRMLFAIGDENETIRMTLLKLWQDAEAKGQQKYYYNLHSETDKSALSIPVIDPEYSDASPTVNGFKVLNTFFDKVLDRNPSVFAFGEDVGHIGDVNQGFAGLQEKYGKERVFDTGIREWSIMGKGLGMAMRGLRPIVEIQYLDYLIYGLEPLSDDLATLRYRSNGQQQAPTIIRTRGHRLEGIWHAGSPMGMILGSLRGIYLCVPRNMTQAVGFYNTMLQSNDPAIIIECLNGYRLKEKIPDNIGEYTVPLGVPEILSEGTDITVVTYGSCVRVAEAGMAMLKAYNISVELIDVQTLLPFDLEHLIVESIQKTNRVVFMDEDVPGGGTAYMMQEVLEKQGAYHYLDSKPMTLSAAPHRPPYGSDGDYFSKPNPEDVFEMIYKMMYESDPQRFPKLF